MSDDNNRTEFLLPSIPGKYLRGLGGGLANEQVLPLTGAGPTTKFASNVAQNSSNRAGFL